MRKRVAVGTAFVAFLLVLVQGLTVGAGLSATLSRALLVLGVFLVVGAVVGWAAELIVGEVFLAEIDTQTEADEAETGEGESGEESERDENAS